jgi:hypothetical protein
MYSVRCMNEAPDLLAPSSPQRAEDGPAGHSALRWLGERTQPRWLTVTGWLSAGWSGVAVVALAVTGRQTILAWWVLGALFFLVVVVVAWTEQPDDAGADGGGADRAKGEMMPSPGGEGGGIDWEARERELARAGETDPGCTSSAARSSSS